MMKMLKNVIIKDSNKHVQQDGAGCGVGGTGREVGVVSEVERVISSSSSSLSS